MRVYCGLKKKLNDWRKLNDWCVCFDICVFKSCFLCVFYGQGFDYTRLTIGENEMIGLFVVIFGILGFIFCACFALKTLNSI